MASSRSRLADLPETDDPEPRPQALGNPLKRWLLATRPAFLAVTLVACLIGLATAVASGIELRWLPAALTLLFALVAHAGANVINDLHDARSGCDAANVERQYPFTGGSRMIQNGVMTVRATAMLGHGLLLSVVPAGIWLAVDSGPGLLAIGGIGLMVGWAYSAPPLRLQSRGLGEFAITLAWLLVIVGTDHVARRGFSTDALAAGLAYALLVANVLYINQFPDRRADEAAGKRTLVVRLGARRARFGYLLILALAAAWLSAMVAGGRLPRLSLLSLVPLLAGAAAARTLWRHAGEPALLVPALKQTILAACGHGLVLAATLVASRG